MSDFEAFLREHGGLKGLARELGQDDPNARVYEPSANDDETSERAALWRRVVAFTLGRDV